MGIGLEPGIVTVQENGNGTFQQLITSGRHTIVADETAPIGTDTGLSPHGFLPAGLGAFKSMAVRMHAQRKKLDLQTISVRLPRSRIHADDCANCETSSVMIDHIDHSITLTGNLTDEQRNRMPEIADGCPVRRTLESEVSINSALA